MSMSVVLLQIHSHNHLEAQKNNKKKMIWNAHFSVDEPDEQCILCIRRRYNDSFSTHAAFRIINYIESAFLFREPESTAGHFTHSQCGLCCCCIVTSLKLCVFVCDSKQFSYSIICPNVFCKQQQPNTKDERKSIFIMFESFFWPIYRNWFVLIHRITLEIPFTWVPHTHKPFVYVSLCALCFWANKSYVKNICHCRTHLPFCYFPNESFTVPFSSRFFGPICNI